MLRENMRHGFSEPEWNAAKEEARAAMIETARGRDTISYSDLVRQVTSIRLEPRDPRLFHMLGEISTEEAAAGRGMLTVVVVHKHGDKQPGPGFFELAKRLGRNMSDEECWVTELSKVYRVWSDK